ncbi:hypothetical protein D5F01_LYC00333 [Larimichthys crocea]|uniref:Uncharacterized protein n=1 Tax=Larimichthys crocea TaxID=215358 RepID=A0A6G0J9C3_LARCR|nr:hypothetical protein D5F01_LYC00333 [Larimichthys crocea]
MNSKQSEGVHCSRQCNQAESAITQKVDLTTGHLVKLKTRHLHCTYSLGNITPISCDWLSGELAPYKRQSDSVEDTIDWHHLLHRHPSSSPVVFPSQKPFPSHGFIKYSIPQPPGRQSVEVYYPYDFSQQRIMTNMPPMTNVPQMPNVLPFDYPQQNIPQQIPNIPSFDANPIPSQDPLQPLQQDQPAQTSQVPPKV